MSALALALLLAVDAPPPEGVEPRGQTEKEDGCAPIREAIEKRQDYLHRLAAERNAFAWMENSKDAEALRLLQAMRRCEAYPDDEDCKPPPIEQRLEDLEPPRHVYERWPSELEVGEKEPDELDHDPKILDLRRKLERCEAERSPKPLLRRDR